LVKQYFPGDVFGELALLYNCPRGATVITKNNVFLWKLDRETFNIIVKEATMYLHIISVIRDKDMKTF
jgi:cAMP-dependent protein kinase regulator